MSRSSSPTRSPRDESENASCAASVDLPTPPFPEHDDLPLDAGQGLAAALVLPRATRAIFGHVRPWRRSIGGAEAANWAARAADAPSSRRSSQLLKSAFTPPSLIRQEHGHQLLICAPAASLARCRIAHALGRLARRSPRRAVPCSARPLRRGARALTRGGDRLALDVRGSQARRDAASGLGPDARRPRGVDDGGGRDAPALRRQAEARPDGALRRRQRDGRRAPKFSTRSGSAC